MLLRPGLLPLIFMPLMPDQGWNLLKSRIPVTALRLWWRISTFRKRIRNIPRKCKSPGILRLWNWPQERTLSRWLLQTGQIISPSRRLLLRLAGMWIIRRQNRLHGFPIWNLRWSKSASWETRSFCRRLRMVYTRSKVWPVMHFLRCRMWSLSLSCLMRRRLDMPRRAGWHWTVRIRLIRII